MPIRRARASLRLPLAVAAFAQLLGTTAAIDACGHCDAGQDCGLCLRLLTQDECPRQVQGAENGGLPPCEPGKVAPGKLCEGDGPCGTSNVAENCPYVTGGIFGSVSKFDIYLSVDCVLSPSTPPPPPSPPDTPPPPPPPSPPPLPKCGAHDKCDAGADCGYCLRLLEQSECPQQVSGAQNGGLPPCEPGRVGPGQLCEGDGPCGTSEARDNCGYSTGLLGFTQPFDIYLRIACSTGKDPLPLTTTKPPCNCACNGPGQCGANCMACDCEGCAAVPPKPPPSPPAPPPPPSPPPPPPLPICGAHDKCDAGGDCGYCLRLLEQSECPQRVTGTQNGGLPPCEPGRVGPGQLCEGDGPCGTSEARDNCGYSTGLLGFTQPFDIYLRVACRPDPHAAPHRDTFGGGGSTPQPAGMLPRPGDTPRPQGDGGSWSFGGFLMTVLLALLACCCGMTCYLETLKGKSDRLATSMSPVDEASRAPARRLRPADVTYMIAGMFSTLKAAQEEATQHNLLTGEGRRAFEARMRLRLQHREQMTQEEEQEML